jgi:uncharacterized protein YprB with RNaseH-like and TPR domain
MQAPARRAPAAYLAAALGARVAATDHGELLVWQKTISEVWSHGGTVARNLWAALRPFDKLRAVPSTVEGRQAQGRPAQSWQGHPEPGRGAALDGVWTRPQAPAGLEALAQADPARIAWLDIESAGFMGRPIFLVGMMRPQQDNLVITQFLAADYSRERALLAECAQALSELEVLVTFNGKCFDLPFLRERMAYHRVPRELEMEHVDLLWPARRQFRGVLPDCRLQTLERHLCRRMRPGDIPSALIPERYHEFVRTQEASLIAPVLRHNRLDLLTMAELSARLLQHAAARDTEARPAHSPQAQ